MIVVLVGRTQAISKIDLRYFGFELKTKAALREKEEENGMLNKEFSSVIQGGQTMNQK